MTRLSVVLAGLTVLGLAAASAVACQAQQATAPIAVTGGRISGTDDGRVRTWLGVPFAAPPVGDLRWRPPQPVLPWSGVKPATAFSPACAPNADWLPNPKSEDCLYLNVWAPEKTDKLPVIVWIHGGGMYGGTAAVPVHDGANLAGHGAIVVTINYRLGILGFFSHPELSAESPDHVSGNQGILDQVAALHWVRDNITAFGGDPDRVTIAGESAGGESVALLVASPLAKGLFQRAISESGNDALPISPDDTHRFNDKTTAEAKGLAYAKSVGAEHLADLRKLSVEDLKKQAWLPRAYVDGYLVPSDLTTIYSQHRQNDVPILVGWNADEGKDLAPEILETGDFTAANHKMLVARLLGHEPSAALFAAYPGDTDAQARASINQLTNDWWGWRMVHWASLQGQYGTSKAYAYYFAHMPAQETPCYYGCGIGHGAEIQYVFDNLQWSKRDWTADDRQLASLLADTWVRFASTGSPEGLGLRAWPAYDGSPGSVHVITTGDDKPAGTLPDFSLFSPAVETSGMAPAVK